MTMHSIANDNVAYFERKAERYRASLTAHRFMPVLLEQAERDLAYWRDYRDFFKPKDEPR